MYDSDNLPGSPHSRGLRPLRHVWHEKRWSVTIVDVTLYFFLAVLAGVVPHQQNPPGVYSGTVGYRRVPAHTMAS